MNKHCMGIYSSGGLKKLFYIDFDNKFLARWTAYQINKVSKIYYTAIFNMLPVHQFNNNYIDKLKYLPSFKKHLEHKVYPHFTKNLCPKSIGKIIKLLESSDSNSKYLGESLLFVCNIPYNKDKLCNYK